MLLQSSAATEDASTDPKSNRSQTNGSGRFLRKFFSLSLSLFSPSFNSKPLEEGIY